MKKILGYIGIIILILGSLITVLILNKKDNIYNSVVYIESIDETTIRSGSGFVYKIEDGINYVVTSYHVIEGYTDVYVYNNEKEKVKADILNYDEYTDIAVLTIKDVLKLKEISIGNSDKVNVNDKIYVIGTPLDISNINTKVAGTILSVNKKITIETTHGSSNLNVIEVNAKVDDGNSGSPLLNSINEVIGMMFIKENDEVSYALPINFVMDIAEKLESKELNRPNLGAVMCNTTNTDLLNEYGINTNHDYGVVLLEVNSLSVLDNAKLQKGDVITKFDNKKITNVNQLREELYKNKIGDKIEIEYYRDVTPHKVIIEL
ncbi:MAG: serine protease [Bacilli bacterium]|nr:serine protease [Bacilli bacterium]